MCIYQCLCECVCVCASVCVCPQWPGIEKLIGLFIGQVSLVQGRLVQCVGGRVPDWCQCVNVGKSPSCLSILSRVDFPALPYAATGLGSALPETSVQSESRVAQPGQKGRQKRDPSPKELLSTSYCEIRLNDDFRCLECSCWDTTRNGAVRKAQNSGLTPGLRRERHMEH